MSDLIKSIIRWVVIAVIIGLVIFFLVKLVNRTNTNKAIKNTSPAVETIRDNTYESGESNVTIDDNAKTETDTNLVVDVQDTASTSGISVIIGGFILVVSSYYIYKQTKKDS